MIIPAVWTWRPCRLRSVNITNLSSAGGNCWMLRAHQTYYASLSMQIVNTFICSDSSKPFSLIIHGWKVVLLDASDRLLAETDDAFEIITVECYTSCATESKEPLHSLLLAFGLSGWQTARKFCLGLLQKYYFIHGWLALCFRCDIIFWKYQHKKVIWIKSGKSLACWKRLTESRRHCGALVGLAPQKNSKPLQIETGNIIDQRNFC